MALFIAIISALSWFIGEYFTEAGGASVLGTALVISGVSGFISYFNSDKMVLGISGAKELKYEDAPEVFCHRQRPKSRCCLFNNRYYSKT